MKKLWTSLINSFDNKNDGFSARKLSAFVAVIIGVYITRYLIPSTEQINALYAWLAFALLCLGIVTIEQILKFKNGDKQGT